jgi:hypothetical protein
MRRVYPSSSWRCRSLTAVVGIALPVWSALAPAAAQNETSPTQQPVAIDWPSVARDVQAVSPHLVSPPANIAAGFSAEVDRELTAFAVENKESFRPLARLNLFIASAYPDTRTVPIPVLAPIDTSRYLAEIGRTGLLPQDVSVSYLAPSVKSMQFLAKTGGYDVLVRVHEDLLKRHRITNTELVTVHLGGTGMVYELGAGAATRGSRVDDKQLQGLYPDIRRFTGADDISYGFSKYGVPYFASITCETRKWPVTQVISCSQVDPIMRAVLLDLRLSGGSPTALERRSDACGPRPVNVSPAFKFYPPGDLPDALSQGGKGGVKTKICWAPGNFRFPLRAANAFANTQIFLHSGDCGGRANQIQMSGGRYRCKQNPTKILEKRESHPENYTYPWRDTYCEVRNDNNRNPPDCEEPIGGHEGQDIRAHECIPNGQRCKIDLFDVVAVTRGKAFWTEKNHIRLVAEDGTGLYYMYLHMSPAALQSAGMRRGEWVSVRQGDNVGKVGNWLGTERDATTAHLHFEIRTPGPPFCAGFGCTSSPYWTLIRAYEQLIQMRGMEFAE